MLAAVYTVGFAAQIFLLVRACRNRGGFGWVLGGNVFATVLACFLLWYFDTLPGYGLMPGFAFFREVFYSLIAAVVYALTTLVSFLCLLYFRKK